jgi:hypothetical protein
VRVATRWQPPNESHLRLERKARIGRGDGQ